MRIQADLDQKQAKRVKDKLKQLSKFSTQDTRKAMATFALKTAADVRKAAPVDTGNLRRNIDYEILTDQVIVESVALTKRGYDYAPIQEYGGRNEKHPARPYFWPAVRRNYKRLIAELNRQLKKYTK